MIFLPILYWLNFTSGDSARMNFLTFRVIQVIMMKIGIEPAASKVEGRRTNHCATTAAQTYQREY